MLYAHLNCLILQTNTFQCVFVSDGEITFALFQYGDGLMQWIQADDKVVAEVGFTDDKLNKFVVPVSSTRDMLLLDYLGNTEIPGVWAFRVDVESVSAPTGCK